MHVYNSTPSSELQANNLTYTVNIKIAPKDDTSSNRTRNNDII
jgi:hypothetical protein